jgi:GNAT superfamily N-acetyltransferase
MVEYVVTLSPQSAEIDAVLANIIAAEHAGGTDSGYQAFGILLKDGDAVIGGLTGYALYDWLFVQFLSVPAALQGRGIGTELLNRAEIWCRERGLVGMWLDTFEFQARPFYEKQGFVVFGTIEDHPVGSRRFFLQKRFAAPTA